MDKFLLLKKGIDFLSLLARRSTAHRSYCHICRKRQNGKIIEIKHNYANDCERNTLLLKNSKTEVN